MNAAFFLIEAWNYLLVIAFVRKRSIEAQLLIRQLSCDFCAAISLDFI